MKKLLLLTLMLAVVSSSAMAEWVYFSESIDAIFYINPDSIQKSGNTVKMWVLGDLNEAKRNNGKTVLSYKNQYEYKCKERQERSIYQIIYSENMGEGKVVQTYDEPDEWVPVIPDSVGAAHLEFACKKQ